MAKLLIKHPELRPYRNPLFDAVAERHQVRFLFNRPADRQRYEHAVIGTTKPSMWRDWYSVRTFFREVALGDYDALVSSTPTASATIAAVTIARLRRKKVVLWTEQWRASFPGWKGKMRRFLFGSVYRLTNAHFVTSTKTAKFLRSNFNVPDSKLFFALQCNRDMAEVKSAQTPLPVPENVFVFLFLARIIHWKGLDYLLRAFAQIQPKHPEAFLFIVGDGEALPRCQQLAEELALRNYVFYGAIPDADVALKAACFAVCDVFVLPSRIVGNQTEGWGLVVGEAMSMSKPVITTDAVGCSEDMIEEGVNGYVVRHSLVEDLANGMKRALQNRDRIPAMGKASRAIFERQVSYARMSRAFLAAIDHALEEIGAKSRKHADAEHVSNSVDAGSDTVSESTTRP